MGETKQWIPEEVVLRGLSMTCISVCDLYEWYKEHANHFPPERLTRIRFNNTVTSMAAKGLVEIQRTVDCRMCWDAEGGIALTHAGRVEAQGRGL